VRCLAIVPARGGSKGLPGKNIRVLAGLPLLVHSLRCAAQAKLLSRVIVSTDSEEIAAVARAYGGDVPFLRDAVLAQDQTPLLPVLANALQKVEAAEGAVYDAIVLLDPTSPARLPREIDEAIEMLAVAAEADGVVACSRPDFNPFWVGCVRDGAYLRPAFEGGSAYVARQQVPAFFRVNGSLYVFRRDFLLAAPGHVLNGKMLLLETPEERAMSIDDGRQFDRAELLIRERIVRLPWLDGEAESAE